MKTIHIFMASMLAIISLFMYCHIDKGIEPLRSAIEGEITFTGDWPEPPLEVKLVSATQFPPSMSELEIGESVPTNVASFKYSYHLEPDTYKLIGVVWRIKDAVWEISSICGVYFSGVDSLLPGEVTIESKESIVTGINIAVDRSKAKTGSNSKIIGDINFSGNWPDSLTSAIVVASVKDPLTESFTLMDLSLSNLIPRDTKSTAYSINVSPATYRAVAVLFFKKDQPLTVNDLYHSQNIGGLVMNDIVVSGNEIVTGPTFNIKIGPVISGIKGLITFQGSWTAPAEEVRLIAATNFPPEFSELIIGDSIPANVNMHNYMFKLRPGAYKLVGVAWRAENTNWDLLSVCGIYFTGTDSLAPATVIITDSTTIIENINIKVNRAKARKTSDTKIGGTIEFKGTWPGEITEARVIATTKFNLNVFPPVLPSLLDLSFSDVIAPGTMTIDYVIKAFPGTFMATGVIFFKQDQPLSLNDILYSSEVGGLNLTPYEVKENETADGPDFVIQF